MHNDVNEIVQFWRPHCWYYGWERFTKKTVQMASDDMMYIPNYMKIASGTKVVLMLLLLEAVILVLLMEEIYEVCR
jgi:hypothetical protein